MNTQTHTRIHTNTHIYIQMRTQKERERERKISQDKKHTIFHDFHFPLKLYNKFEENHCFVFVFYSSSHDTSDFHVFQSWGLGYDQDTLTIHSKDVVVTQD